jgi:glycerol-3-phosphate dehydrogenase
VLTPRALASLAAESFDLIIVGGGIYGVVVALEAVRRGLQPLVLERSDFGAATSHNSLRIVHGGFRYLQSADLARFHASVRERRWFLQNFPDLVEPLPCLMPLYGDGLHRKSVFRGALLLNDALSFRRNVRVEPSRRLPRGRIVSREETASIFPTVNSNGLQGGALWYDAFMPSAPRVLIEALIWACSRGAAALNYVEAQGLIEDHGRVVGVRASDVLMGGEFEFRASRVVNATGPWSRRFTSVAAKEQKELFEPSLAWNVVLRRPPLSDHAVAVAPRRPDARTYFLVPWKGALLAGTGHAVWRGSPDDPRPSLELLGEFLGDLNAAVPGLDLGEGDVVRVSAGLLPATGPGTCELTKRDVILDHGLRGGPSGFFSLSGIKWTTVRRVAERVLRCAFPSAAPLPDGQFQRAPGAGRQPDYPFSWMPHPGDEAWKKDLRSAASGEAVHHLDDLLLRRSSVGDNPERALQLGPEACRLLGWDAERSKEELDRLSCKLRAATWTGLG